MLVTFIIFCLFLYGVQNLYGMSVYPDEFGYWASAAQAAGYDWSEVASLGSYYSYGYSLLLFPVLKLCRNGIMAYRAAVFLNVLLQGISLWLIWGVLCRMFPERDSNETALAAGVSVLYPVWSFYAQMTLAEALLFFLYLLLCYLLLLFLEKGKTIWAVMSAIVSVYTYCVHMRTLGLPLSCIAFFAVVFWKISGQRKNAVLAICIIFTGIAAAEVIKQNVIDTVYAVADRQYLAVNDYGGKGQMLLSVVSGENFLDFVKSVIGKLYYLLLTSFGLAYFAFKYLTGQMRSLIRSFRKKEAPAPRNLFAFFVLLASLCQIGVSAVFTCHPGRLDSFVYGRYNDYLLPLLIGSGMLELWQSKKKVRDYIVILAVTSLSFVIIYHAMLKSGLESMHGIFAAGISYFTRAEGFQVGRDFAKAFLLGLVLIMIVTLCIFMTAKKGKSTFLALIILLEAGLAILLGEKYTYPYNDVDHADIRMADYINENADENTLLMYVNEGGIEYIDLLQFHIMDKSIHVVTGWEEENASIEDNARHLMEKIAKEGYGIVKSDSRYREILEHSYNKVLESGNFVLLEL